MRWKGLELRSLDVGFNTYLKEVDPPSYVLHDIGDHQRYLDILVSRVARRKLHKKILAYGF